ncbi:type I secretion system permease/ATPase [Phreatobacter stygius]|uniref:Type I secretion system permease/ATPase n=1 Tax=Phreatobacter stygius TaxID=1940610 RepID=A0A4D7B0J0_9HYPH|nr:type I secretion system permease/ATPase [Phreatobacter stygius]QCI66241.1 type I secretion system permease/ATPase [Phreatobacter stygius]
MSFLSDDHFLRQELPKFRSAIAALFFFSSIITILFLIPSIYMYQVFERVMQSRNMSTLLFLTMIVAALTVIWTALEHIRTRVLGEMANSLDESISTRAFDAVNRQTKVLSADARTMVIQDLNIIRDFVSGSLPVQFMDLCFVPLIILAVFLFHPVMGAALLALSVVVVGLSFWTQRAARHEIKRSLTASTRANEFARSVMASSEASRAMGMMPSLTGRWRDQVRGALGWQEAATHRATLPSSLLKYIRHLYTPIMLCVGVLLFLAEQVGPGVVFAAVMVVGRAIQPVDAIANNWRSFWSAQMSIDRIDRLLREAGPSRVKVTLPVPDGPLQVSRIVATPSDRDNIILTDVSFVVNPGSITAVVGSSGAGKSSLAKVLVGAWSVRKGTITLDGHDLTHWDQDQLGRHIGYVPQDVVLLPGTLAENIARFDPLGGETDRKIIEAVKIAGIQDIVSKLPDGLNTKIGPNGHTLSGGQRQRVALARAVYGDPQLVVLDEPNSNLDAIGEKGLAETLEILRDRGAIVILVTHRLNMLSYCDHVLVMNSGTVHAFGPRDAVVSRLSLGQPVRQIGQQNSASSQSGSTAA